MSVEKPEELKTTPVLQTAALTDAERAELEALRAEKERAELEALRAEKERRELEALRAEKTRTTQVKTAAQVEAPAVAEDAQLRAAQQRAAHQAAQQEAEQIRRIQEQRAKGRALMEPDEDDEDKDSCAEPNELQRAPDNNVAFLHDDFHVFRCQIMDVGGNIALNHEDEFGSLEKGKLADLLVVKGDVASNIHDLTPDNMEVIMKEGDIVIRGAL